MQYLTVTKDMTLLDFSNIVGERNLDYVLNINGLSRSVNIGKEFFQRNNDYLNDVADDIVDYQTKTKLLNQLVGDSDLFEKAALGTEDDWKILSQFNCFNDAVRIPIEVQLPDSEGVLGNAESVDRSVYDKCMQALEIDNTIPPTIFSEYNASAANGSLGIIATNMPAYGTPWQWFKIPWGEVGLYSSVGEGDMIYFPVYPEGFDDGVAANYDEMPEMLYQYEPWKVYKSSGPREITFDFEFHRDMWTGDHRDGSANTLIRACEACCYPQYDGSLVNVSTVTLYIHGQSVITGVMTGCRVTWSGPIGLDGFYLMCKLSITIVEVSPQALNYDVIRNKGLIG